MLVKFKKLEEEEEEEDYVETATCGIRSSFSVLISGGEETAPGDWPWMALLGYSDPELYVEMIPSGPTHCLTTVMQALCWSSDLLPSCSHRGSLRYLP